MSAASERFFQRLNDIVRRTRENPITIALSMMDDPDFAKAVDEAQRDENWTWIKWLSEPGDDSRRKFWEYPPSRLQRTELLQDWREQLEKCRNCKKGDACSKTTKYWLATLEQSDIYKRDTGNFAYNYVVYYPCQWNNALGTRRQGYGERANFNTETGSDLL